jgi:hypothetical protein
LAFKTIVAGKKKLIYVYFRMKLQMELHVVVTALIFVLLIFIQQEKSVEAAGSPLMQMI